MSKIYYTAFLQKVLELRNRVNKLYIYGAGFYGKDVFRLLQRNNLIVDGFVVTKEPTENFVLGVPVYSVKEKINEDCGFIIAMTPIYAEEVFEYLAKESNTKFGKNTDRIIVYGAQSEDNSGRKNYMQQRVLELTLVVGCRVDCRFCPQKKLITSYFATDKSKKKYLMPDDFKKILSNIENDRILMFAGFGEPFLNPHCMELLEIACKAGRVVHFFTTLEGASVDDVERLITLPIDLCTVHLADKLNYAKITLNDEYYEKLRIITTAKKADGSLFVDYINAQTDPDEKAYKIVRDNYEVMVSVHDRGGNVEYKEAEHIKINLATNDRIICQCAGEMLDSNVVLPDGTLVLCNSDYGLKHVLGNLIEEDMNKIRNGDAFKSILDAFQGKRADIDLLCRTCSNIRLLSDT